jgi:hypothetical protein
MYKKSTYTSQKRQSLQTHPQKNAEEKTVQNSTGRRRTQVGEKPKNSPRKLSGSKKESTQLRTMRAVPRALTTLNESKMYQITSREQQLEDPMW